MKRNNSSAEDMVRRMIKPSMSGPTKAEEESLLGLWRISDKRESQISKQDKISKHFQSIEIWVGSYRRHVQEILSRYNHFLFT